VRVGWRRLSTESAGVGEKRLWLTGLVSTAVRPSVFSLLRKTGSGGDDRNDSGRLFQTDAAAARKWHSVVVCTLDLCNKVNRHSAGLLLGWVTVCRQVN